MSKEPKEMIMYDSPEAASIQTITGWVSGSKGGYKSIFWGEDEHQARWSGCTHIKCECGNIREKAYTCCEDCRVKNDRERHMKLEYKEWDCVEPVMDAFGDKYFFNLEDLEEYMAENQMEEINLLICEPIHYSSIDCEDIVGGEAHEDWEPSGELEQKIKELNEYLSTLPAHSWYPGKIRTSHKINLAGFKD